MPRKRRPPPSTASPQAAQIDQLHATAQGEVYACNGVQSLEPLRVLLRGKRDFPARLFRTESDPLSMSGLVRYETHLFRPASTLPMLQRHCLTTGGDEQSQSLYFKLVQLPTSTCKALPIPLIIDLGSSVRGVAPCSVSQEQDPSRAVLVVS
ncbi:hypothetical protein BDZ85DRAFT_28958 [Elsinoe ampelina]|uniref:Uncharacterized protein n=1 Tax=Elsinoe ampelina TaxID=302913 RepID=A0A6A6G4Z0_9PEZI|nr:hypothetical protein BDZ85DRAFT_28958 [Elsinoe ampelina]